jgi:hypothetical protein
MKGSKALLVTLAMTAGLLALLVALRGPYARLAAEHWQSQLDTVPDDQAGSLLRQAAELGEPGIPVLVEALGSKRESVAREGKRVLWEQLDRWQMLRARASSPKLAVLADALAERVDRFGPTARRNAADLAARILLWPLDSRTVDQRQVIASCEQVFRASAAGGGGKPLEGDLAILQGPPTGRSNRARHRPLPAEDPMQWGSSLVDLCRLPGGGLPIEWFPRPAAPQLAEAPLPDDVRAEQPRRLEFPAVARPLDPWRLLVRPRTAAEQPDTMPDFTMPDFKVHVDQPPGEPNVNRALSLTEPADGPPDSLPDDFSEIKTVELMQWLRHEQESRASGARAELIRRGFTEVHLELARRLFDPDTEVRKQLARLLPGVQSVDPLPWLEWLSRDPDPEVRLVAIGLLGTTGDATLLEQIERTAREDPDPRVRQQAERIAGRPQGNR